METTNQTFCDRWFRVLAPLLAATALTLFYFVRHDDRKSSPDGAANAAVLVRAITAPPLKRGSNPGIRALILDPVPEYYTGPVSNSPFADGFSVSPKLFRRRHDGFDVFTLRISEEAGQLLKITPAEAARLNTAFEESVDNIRAVEAAHVSEGVLEDGSPCLVAKFDASAREGYIHGLRESIRETLGEERAPYIEEGLQDFDFLATGFDEPRVYLAEADPDDPRLYLFMQRYAEGRPVGIERGLGNSLWATWKEAGHLLDVIGTMEILGQPIPPFRLEQLQSGGMP